jgi:hypothetical protein
MMANPNFPPGHFFKSKMSEPRAVEKARKDRHEEASLRAAYRLVDKRDGRVCQVTREHLVAGHPDAKKDLTRHHLEERSLNKSRRFSAANIWTVSRSVHSLINAKGIEILDKRGEKALDVRQIYKVVWNRDIVPHAKEPFRIKFHRAGAK